MKDEIKKILDYLKNDDYSPVFADEGCDDTPYKLFDETEVKLLLDYITNLQQENERLKDDIDRYKQIVEGNDNCIKALRKEYEDYKSRCEKAIEYLKNLKNYRFEFTFDSIDRHEIVGCEKNFVKDLLNILQNGSEDK